ncbi:MAG: PAS domain S-box protein, partial [Candidatus Cloacimonadales bacterium]
VFVSGKSAKVERFLPRQNIWVDARAYPIYDDQGKIVKIIEHLRDITEQKKTEELIISNQKLSNAIIKDSPLGISVRDKNGTLILYNQAWQNIWDLSAAAVESYQVKRENLILSNKDNYLGQHLPAVQDVYQHGGSYYVHEVKTSKSRPGQAEWISQRFYAITDQNNLVDQVVVLTEDISERKHSQLVHDVMFKISNHVNIKQSLYRLLDNIRQEVSRLMNTKNFYIAILDRESGKLLFPYCKDEKDNETRPTWPGKTLSGYVIKTGKPLLVENILDSALVKSGAVEAVGYPSKVWLGVPLIYNNVTLGLVALQSYEDSKLYNQNDLKTLEFISHEIATVLEKKRIDDEIAVQKIYFENLFEVSPDALVILSNEDKVMRVNAEFSKLFGYSNQEAQNHYINDLIVPSQFKEEGLELTQEVKIGNSVAKQTIRKSKLGEEIYVEIIGKPIILKSNQLAVLGIYRDIRERVLAENRMKQDLQVNKTLLQELYHRTKNNMQVISSLLYMSSSQTKDQHVKETFRSINNKIKAMSLVHKKLYQSQDLSKINLAEYLEDLLKLIINSYGIQSNAIQLNFAMQDIYILMDSAIPLGLVINELVSNILKHAFRSQQADKEISLQLEQNAADEIILTLRDNGQGIPADFRFEDSSSLGLKTAISLIRRQLKGEIEYRNESGLSWQIKIKDEQHQARV